MSPLRAQKTSWSGTEYGTHLPMNVYGIEERPRFKSLICAKNDYFLA